ncbi:MAG: ComF family protein [Armatimonadota bacterium]|nr:ComF family protein [Armatimonadota bacterium]
MRHGTAQPAVRSVLQPWGRALLDLLFPPRCQVCGAPDAFPVCTTCTGSFERIAPPVCQQCGRPLRGPADLVFTCIPCRKWKRHPLDCVRAFGVYDGLLREAIHALKYARRLALAEPLGEMLAGTILGESRLGATDALVPVPLHPRREGRRGFNQAEEIARTVSARCGLPVRRLLARRRDTQPQAGLDESERRDNVDGAFAVRGAVRGLQVLLIDDVVTTGSTLAACARALRTAGAAGVCAAAVAMTVRDP